MAKEKRIYSTGYALLGRTGAPSDALSPGGYTVLDEDNASHKAILRDIESGAAPHLSVQEVDLEQEAKTAGAGEFLESNTGDPKPTDQDVELARARAEIAGDGGGGAEDPDGSGGEGDFNPEEHTVSDVLAYLQDASGEEVSRVQELEANSSRSSKQVADFEKKAD